MEWFIQLKMKCTIINYLSGKIAFFIYYFIKVWNFRMKAVKIESEFINYGLLKTTATFDLFLR